MWTWGRGRQQVGAAQPGRSRGSHRGAGGIDRRRSNSVGPFSTEALRNSLPYDDHAGRSGNAHPRRSLGDAVVNSTGITPVSSDEQKPSGKYTRGKNYNRGSKRFSGSGPTMGNSHTLASNSKPICSDPSLQYALLCENKTKNYVRCSNVMIILRGLPGSGKTYLGQKMQETYGRNSVVCSADHYFEQGGVYRFNPTKLRDAHEQSHQRASQAVSNGKHLIIIDNTNVQIWEMEFYVKCANEHNYVILFIEPKTNWKTDVSVLAKVSQHRVDEEKLLQRKRQWDRIDPLYYGWYLNSADSLTLVKTGLDYFDECLRIPEFASQIREQINLSGDRDLEGYYNVENRRSLHVTAMYLGNQSRNESRRYQSLEAVRKAYGAATAIKVIGFVLTPYTIGARVMLTPLQLGVYGQDDNEKSPPVQVGLDVMRNSTRAKPKKNRSTQTTSIPTLKSEPNCSLNSKKRFHPTDGRGRRAHITLGVAGGVQDVQTGFDLLQAIDFERETNRSKKDVPTSVLNGAVAKKFGDDIWVIYPERMYTMDALFAFYTDLGNESN